MKKLRIVSILALMLGLSSISSAQNESFWHWSLESNDVWYTDQNDYGSNNYLKLDWSNKHFQAGAQAEWHPQPLLGYDLGGKGFALPEKFIRYNTDNFNVTLGDWYDQFGSGLIFRSWEDRALGMNNSIGGARMEYKAFDGFIGAKLVWGHPRHLRKYSGTQILGSDIALPQIGLFGGNLGLGFSFLERFEKELPYYLEEDWTKVSVPRNNASWSAAASYNIGDFYIKGEYCGKQKDWHDFSVSYVENLQNGEAIYLESGLAVGKVTGVASFRRLRNMTNKVFRTNETFLSNTLNYIPALSLQHTYMLCALEPYYPNTDGESAWQIDIIYKAGKKDRLHLNYSEAHNLRRFHKLGKAALLFRDISLKYERRWNRRLRSVFFLNIQESSPSHGVHRMTEVRNTFVADATYRITDDFSMRGEIQYLYSAESAKDWCAALLEANLTSGWSIFAKDMYNHGSSKIHYYQAGGSYSRNHFRISASYGRNREGMVCSGGVCRWQPGFTGGNLSISIVF